MLFPHVWLRSTGFPFDWLDELALRPGAPGARDPLGAVEDVQDPEEEAAFRRHTADARRALLDRLAGPLAREALFLSNPEAADRLDSLARGDLARLNSRNRQRARLAWSYAQRLCAKNETISFFGPLAWGRVRGDTAPGFALWEPDPGAGWLRRRRVAFEHWVVERICARIAEAHADRLPPALHSACDLDGDELRAPVGRRIPLPPAVARHVRALIDGGTPGAGSESVRAQVARLAAAGVLRPALRVPPGTERPLDAVRGVLEQLPARPRPDRAGAAGPDGQPAGPAPRHLRQDFDALEVVAELERQRRAFENGGPEERGAARTRMLAVLTGAGVDVQRPSGTHYAGRSPVYEDCERNVRFEIGGPLARRLEADLTPALRLYRVVAECAAARLHEHYTAVFGRLGTDDFVAFAGAVRSAGMRDTLDTVTAELRAALAKGWTGLATAQDLVRVDGEGLEQVAAAVSAACPGHGRFADTLGVGVVSPDVMLAAPGLTALREGRAGIVVGEVHPCVLTALQPVPLPFLTGADRDAALDAADSLLGTGRILLAATDRDHQRSQISWPVTPHLYEVELPGATSRCPADRRIPAGRGRVAARDGRLHFVDRRTGRSEDMATVLSSDLHRVMFDLASDVLGGCLPQRVLHNGTVLKRRSWRMESADVPQAPRPAEELHDYRLLRAWAARRGLPRRGFVKTDAERKPVYLDWRSPLAVDMFAKLVHQARSFTVTEMLPGPGALWFAGDHGRHTAEFRMSFVV